MRRLLTGAVVAGLTAVAGPGRAEPLATIITDRAGVGLPATLAITAIHLPPRLAALDVDPTTVDVDFPPAARPGRTSVKVRLSRGHRRTVFVPVSIAALADVALAAHDLAAGTLVAAADLRWERRPVGRVTTPSAIVGALVSAPISAGEVVDDARLTMPPAVPRGTEVEVRVERGVISVATRGHLEQATRLGAVARVRLRGGGFASGVLARADRVIVEAP